VAAIINHIDNTEASVTTVTAERLFAILISVIGLHRTDDLKTTVRNHYIKYVSYLM